MFGWARINITKPFSNLFAAQNELLISFLKVLKTFLKVVCGFLKVKKARPKVMRTFSKVQKRFPNIEKCRHKPWPTVLNISGRQIKIGNDRINIQKRRPMRCFLDIPVSVFDTGLMFPNLTEAGKRVRRWFWSAQA